MLKQHLNYQFNFNDFSMTSQYFIFSKTPYKLQWAFQDLEKIWISMTFPDCGNPVYTSYLLISLWVTWSLQNSSWSVFFTDCGLVLDLYREYGFYQRLTMINKEFPGANVVLHKLPKLPKVSNRVAIENISRLYI